MNLSELADTLREMCQNAPEGDKVAMIHLFGVKHAREISSSGSSCKAIAKAAGINDSYATEIGKGVRLAKYVTPKEL